MLGRMSALSAHVPDTEPTVARKQHLKKEVTLHVPGEKANSPGSIPKRPSVSDGTFLGNVLGDIAMPSSTLAHSAENPITMPSLTPAIDTMLLRIVTPMSADAFDSILAATDLTYKYPKLASKIRNGFPIGDPNPPEKTTILENHIHHPDDSTVIREYLDAETAKGHMAGPFTKEEMDGAVGGVTWVASPVMVVRTPGEHGGPEKTRVVINSSKKNDEGISVNEQLHCDDTTWGTAADVAEIVSDIYILFPLPSLRRPLLVLVVLNHEDSHPCFFETI